MTRDEHKTAIRNLMGMIAPDHQANASEILTNLSDDYEETLTNYETASADVTRLTANNETLRDVNAKLFLRVGQTEKETQKKEHENGTTEMDDKPIPFSDLFNEKGELI